MKTFEKLKDFVGWPSENCASVRDCITSNPVAFVQKESMSDKLFETGLIGGTEKRDITIVGYDRNWPKKFEKHANSISNALGAVVLRIEHIGSTAVPDSAPNQ